MPMNDVLMLEDEEIQKMLDMDEALAIVERALVLEARGETAMPPKVYLDMSRFGGDFRAMPAYIDGAVGMKWVCVYPGNPEIGLPTVMGTILLNDPRTGRLLAVLDATHITALRTGAAGGVAVKYLAREDAATLGIVGAGIQGRNQLRAISLARPGLKEVKIFDINAEKARRFAGEMGPEVKLKIKPVGSIAEAAASDIVVTVTPSREPFLAKELVLKGTHINGFGADAPGKQEMGGDLLKSARIFVDSMEQASTSGQINVPLKQGLLDEGSVIGTLGQVVAGRKQGRQSPDDITVFDSTGLAILDIACAKAVYEKARGWSAGITMD